MLLSLCLLCKHFVLNQVQLTGKAFIQESSHRIQDCMLQQHRHSTNPLESHPTRCMAGYYVRLFLRLEGLAAVALSAVFYARQARAGGCLLRCGSRPT